jgi:hypothetical protein
MGSVMEGSMRRPERAVDSGAQLGAEELAPASNSGRERVKEREKRGGKVAHQDAKLRRRMDVEERRRSGGSTVSSRAQDCGGGSEQGERGTGWEERQGGWRSSVCLI